MSSVHPSVRPTLDKTKYISNENKAHSCVQTVGLAEWILDDPCLVCFDFIDDKSSRGLIIGHVIIRDATKTLYTRSILEIICPNLFNFISSTASCIIVLCLKVVWISEL